MRTDWVRERSRSAQRGAQERPAEPPPPGATRPSAPPAAPPPPQTAPPEVVVVWKPLGLQGAALGQHGLQSRVAGRIRSIAASPDGTRVYAAGAGGVRYSENSGDNWVWTDPWDHGPDIVGDLPEASALSIGALGVGFGATPALDQVWVGTGEHPEPSRIEFRNASLSRTGVGVRRAVGPGHATWTGVDPTQVREAANLWGKGISALAISPDGAVWVGTDKGLFYRASPTSPAEALPVWPRVEFAEPEVGIADVVVSVSSPTDWIVWFSTVQGKVYRAVRGEWPALVSLGGGFPADSNRAAPVGRIRLAAAPGQNLVYALARPNRLWRISGATGSGVPVFDVPPHIFGSSVYSSPERAMAIAVCPVEADRLLLGGAEGDEGHAALYRVQVTLQGSRLSVGGGGGPEMVGYGVHPNVYCISWVEGAGGLTHVFVGTEGGVYRSQVSGDVWTFRDRNGGLSPLNISRLAGSERMEGEVLAGTQGTGAVELTSPAGWRVAVKGDASGVAIDPADSRRRIVDMGRSWQVTQDGATWRPTFFFVAPRGASARTLRRFSSLNRYDKFNEGKPAVIVHPDGTTQMAIGSQQIWYSESWGGPPPATGRRLPAAWVSLPSGRAPDLSSLGHADSYRDPALTSGPYDVRLLELEWADPDTLWGLSNRELFLLQRNPAGAWSRTVLAEGLSIGSSSVRESVTCFCIHDAAARTCYLGTNSTGVESTDRHVFWFDGTTKIDAGLHVDVSVYALLVDPRHREKVYVGTPIGLFRGTMTTHSGAPPTWAWEDLSIGLPESGVTDLSFHRDTHRLRVSLLGGAVWELDVDAAPGPLPQRVRLRAFAGDLRHRTFPADAQLAVPRRGATRPYVASSYEPVRWDESPDIRVRRAVESPSWLPSTPIAVRGAGERSYPLQALQAALRATFGPSAPGMGFDDEAFAAYIHPHLANGLSRTPRVTPADWGILTNRVPTALRGTLPLTDPTGAAVDPVEATTVVLDEPDPSGHASCAASHWPSLIDVILHVEQVGAAGSEPTRVALLRAPYDRLQPATVPLLPEGWAAELLADAARPTSTWTPAGWTWVESDAHYRTTVGAIDATSRRTLTFQASLPIGDWLLVAVVVHPAQPLSTSERNPLEAARLHHQIACRSVHVAPNPILLQHTFYEWHDAAPAPSLLIGHSEDDTKVILNQENELPVRKEALHLDFLERCVVVVGFVTDAAFWYGSWVITTESGRPVAEHPVYTRARLQARDPAARLNPSGTISMQERAWMWDGRDHLSAGAFVEPGHYFSVFRVVRDGSDHVTTTQTRIEVKGDPYRVTIVGRPKPDDMLRPMLSTPFSAAGERVAADAIITVHRGEETVGSTVFVGHGTLEDTHADGIALPRSTTWKGWVVNPPSGPSEIAIGDERSSAGHCSLRAASPPPLNPASLPEANRPWKSDVRLHAGAGAWTSEALSNGGMTVTPLAVSSGLPGLVWTGFTVRESSMGTSVLSPSLNELPFRNKQRTETRNDGLVVDTPEAPYIPPEGRPWHFQPTLQQAVWGGFRRQEIPTHPGVAHDAPGKVQVRARVEPYTSGSLYHVYHHAAVQGHHAVEVSATEWRVTLWRPRTVLRGWNGQLRSLLTDPSRMTGSWFVQRTHGGAALPYSDLLNPAGTFTEGLPVGRLERTWLLAMALPPGRYDAVLEYRIALGAGDAARDAWVPEGLMSDVLSSETPTSRAVLASEQIVEEGGARYLRGRSLLHLVTV